MCIHTHTHTERHTLCSLLYLGKRVAQNIYSKVIDAIGISEWTHLSNIIEWPQEWEATFACFRTQKHLKSLSCKSLFSPSSYFFLGIWWTRGYVIIFYISKGVTPCFPSLHQGTGRGWSITLPCHGMPQNHWNNKKKKWTKTQTLGLGKVGTGAMKSTCSQLGPDQSLGDGGYGATLKKKWHCPCLRQWVVSEPSELREVLSLAHKP